MNKTITFEVAKTEIFQGVKEGFVLAKCHIADFSQVANGFKFTRESFEKSASQWSYIPIKGEWLSETGTFGGHGGKHIIGADGSYEYQKTTEIYGCVLNTPPRFEEITTINGDKKEMFTVDLVLWLEQYPEQLQGFADGVQSFKQSMEIVINDSHYDESYVDIVTDFSPSALCILQEATPAFKDSKIIPANFSEAKFQELVVRVKQLENKFNKEGGECVNYEELYNELKGQFEELEAKYSQLETEYSTQEEEFAKKRKKCEEYEETISAHETEMNEVKAEYEEKVSALHGELDTVKAQYEEVQIKYTELESQFAEVNGKYQEKLYAEEMKAKEELVGTFADILTKEEVEATIGADLAQFTLEEIDTKLTVVVGKKSKANFSKKPGKQEPQQFMDFGTPSMNEFQKMAEEIKARKQSI